MIKRSLEQLAEMFEFDRDILDRFGDVEISGVCIDTRKIEQGNLFVPFKGEKVDGHTMVRDAFEKGASAALWEKEVPNPPEDLPILIVDSSLIAVQELSKSYRNQLDLKVVGVTGSNGKTSTKDMIYSILSQKYAVQKTEGNYNNHLGLPLTLLSLKETTEVAVLEMGMSGRGEIEFLTKLAKPDFAVITNIGESHLQDLGSREGIAEAKLEIAEGLDEDGVLIYFGDEPLLTSRLNKPLPYQTQSFGRSKENDVYPIHLKPTDSGTRFGVNILPETEFDVPVLGEHNVMNAMSALIIGHRLGLSAEQLVKGISGLKLTSMRMERLTGMKESVIINDAYNASPTSMRAAIKMAEEFEGCRNKFLVLGDMLELGDMEKQFHTEVGKTIHPDKIDEVFTFGPLSRFIAEGAKQNFSENAVHAFEDKEGLINLLKKKLGKNDLVVVKASRGMKLEEVVEALKN
ncbi:UDP-N-acetylmuramoyl-tripeptide--D-alanyl-D-alanine ligase [Falsibacillus albus]|uniref:UDP-N-acetylmuramoyl-tripeptide--D-alanyl-D-alanine ligase n=1 Tax=Falsibacillus albus TaxID=2478915 RepID=A0A3L7JXM2_9BACI|nr:UDP-N-acetylmuramoyl-tripeptide--D-alanyl-D-alanine ligase [Falsibacillus albus]RLQ93182.1 UDP-N-acetylmuramoyl-tripeptide--D-alanyl-D-alanine ligase [Falsibacillus albus]